MRLGYSLSIRPKMCQVLLKTGRETASVPDFGDAPDGDAAAACRELGAALV